MILQLMIALIASSLASEEKCPDDQACLYHYRCSNPSPIGEDIVKATTNLKEREWVETRCETMISTTRLWVRPLSNHKWIITLLSDTKNEGISFGDSLTILLNKTAASFKEPSGTLINIPVASRNGLQSHFTVSFKEKNLLELFASSKIFYVSKNLIHGSINSTQESFWDRIREITPCDASLIVDICTRIAGNCTQLDQNNESAKCLDNDKMWLNTEKSSWQEITSISCNLNKEWKMVDLNGTEIVRNKTMTIVCAAEEPEPWNSANTILHASILPFILYFIMQ